MKLVCFIAVALALCAGAAARGSGSCKSFDLVKGSPVSVVLEFDRKQGWCAESLTPAKVHFDGGGRRHLLQLEPPANISSIPGADEALPYLTGDFSLSSNSSSGSVAQNPTAAQNSTVAQIPTVAQNSTEAQNSTVAGRRLLSWIPEDLTDMKDWNPSKDWKPSEEWKHSDDRKHSDDWKKSKSCPTTFKVPVSLKKSASGGFVTIAVDFSDADICAVLEYFSQWTYNGYCRQAVVNAHIVIFPEATGPEIVDIISTEYFLGSDGKGRTETFGFKGDVDTVQTCKDKEDCLQTGARIFLAFEIQEICWGYVCTTYQFMIPAIDFTVEKYSLPTVHGIVDTLCE